MGVLVGDAFDRINHQQTDIGSLEVAPSHHDRQHLGAAIGLALASNPGGVDEHVAHAVLFEHGVDGIAGGPRHLADQKALVTQEPVDQRRLADVGAADDRDRDPLAARFGFFFLLDHRLGQVGIQSVPELVKPGAVLGRDHDRGAETQPVELVRLELDRLAVALVDHGHDGDAEASQVFADLLVFRDGPGFAVEQKDHHIAAADCGLGLTADQRHEGVLVHHQQTTGVDEGQGAATGALDLADDAVAGHPGQVVDQGAAAAGEPVEEGGLADVGAANHHHYGLFAHCGFSAGPSSGCGTGVSCSRLDLPTTIHLPSMRRICSRVR